jgi:hypothetical protein
MSDQLLQFIIVIALGGLCFGCGCLTAFIVARTKFRNEMIKRGVASYNQQTGKWEWGEPPKKPKTWEVQWSKARRIAAYCEAAAAMCSVF